MFFLIILLSLPLSLARCASFNAIPPLAHSSPYCITSSLFPLLFFFFFSLLFLLPPFSSSAEATRRACRDSQAGFLPLPSSLFPLPSSSSSSLVLLVLLVLPLLLSPQTSCDSFIARVLRNETSSFTSSHQDRSTAIEYKSVIKS